MPTKKVVLIFIAICPLPSKRSCRLTNGFFAVFSKNTAFLKKLVLLWNIRYLISDKKGDIYFLPKTLSLKNGQMHPGTGF